ncbi:hypothetical protein BC937DRAFT_91590 [Endogone sp. FLAS-F59071]|nr:hypothetical protein BC937DRAFT_91590 [Endogone sp. FLAS-F59071]|eukprot:RUS16126.1 hypothetical protein BC937DRAFT_91590 [Endogone sp. FLAS-F59071]
MAKQIKDRMGTTTVTPQTGSKGSVQIGPSVKVPQAQSSSCC